MLQKSCIRGKDTLFMTLIYNLLEKAHYVCMYFILNARTGSAILTHVTAGNFMETISGQYFGHAHNYVNW